MEVNDLLVLEVLNKVMSLETVQFLHSSKLSKLNGTVEGANMNYI